MRRFALFLLVFWPLLFACGARQAVAPTPFPTANGTSTIIPQGPITLSLVELAAAPGFYKDTLIQVTGQFHKEPLLVCESNPFSPPSTWALAEEGVSIPAGGFDEQVRTLLPETMTVTAEGRWRQWQGLIGCGKQAQPREIWYLDVSRILSPSPLTQVTLTPSLGEAGTSIAEVPIEGEDLPTLTPEGLGGGEESLPIVTVEPTPETEPGELPEATATFAIYPEEVPETTPTVQPTEATASPALTPVITATIATPTNTPISGTPTATVASLGPGIDQGDLYSSDAEFSTSRLEANTIHSWSIDLLEGESVTVYAIAPQPANLTLTVTRGDEVIINEQNNAAAGNPEVVNFTSNTPGDQTYEVLVKADTGIATDYAILPYLTDDFPTTSIAGFINPGSPQSNITLAADSVHFWFFTAESGRNLTVRVVPNAESDPVFYLYGPGAEYIEAIDNGFEGDEEIYQDVLQATGLHAIRIYEFNYSSMTYQLEITFQ